MAVDSDTAELFRQLYAKTRPGKAAAFFDSAMDQLIYLQTSTTYRAERVDQYLTLLLHPQGSKVIGVKIKGFRWVFDQLKDRDIVEESHFIPLYRAISALLELAVGEGNRDDEPLLRQCYRQAEEVVGDYRFDRRDLARAA